MGMNLHAIAVGVTSVVNSTTTVTIERSDGTYTTDAAGVRTPNYAAPEDAEVDVQALTTDDLHQLDGLNIQGTSCKMYLNGALAGVVRVGQLGGDLVTLPDGSKWLVTHVLERWADWCAVAITLQNGS